MRRIFREWLDGQFAAWMLDLNAGFEEIKATGGPGMAKGRAFRRCEGKACAFIVLRYQVDRTRVFLSLAWSAKKTVPSDEIRAQSLVLLRSQSSHGEVFETDSGWLEASDCCGGATNYFEPACPALSDEDIQRLSSSKSLLSYWHALGIPSDPLKADCFQRENVLTWDSVGDLSPELITQNDCARFFGSMTNQVRDCLETAVLPAAQRWYEVKHCKTP